MFPAFVRFASKSVQWGTSEFNIASQYLEHHPLTVSTGRHPTLVHFIAVNHFPMLFSRHKPLLV